MDSTGHTTCRLCGLNQLLPEIPPRMRAACARCGASLKRQTRTRRNQTTAALALAALILYPAAVTMPMITIRQLGHQNESSVLEGVTSLLADGQLGVGLIVLLCSVVFPLGKLLAILILTLGTQRVPPRRQALTYAIVQFTGRWGMMDVLLVAILVAGLKLGSVMDVTPGPAALAFGTCVVLSLLAGASFDPRQIWESDR